MLPDDAVGAEVVLEDDVGAGGVGAAGAEGGGGVEEDGEPAGGVWEGRA